MATATERSFLQLRKRLDQLGYRQPLAIESLPLVEKLFDDLVQTTDSLRLARQDLGDRQQKTEEVQEQIEPYQSENARLVTENRDLHLRLIQNKDECSSHTRENKANLRRLEHQNSDLQFLNTQYVVRIKALEKEVRDRNDRVQQLQEKNLQATIQTPGGRKKTIAFRRQRMEIDCPVPPGNDDQRSSKTALPRDPYVADLLRVADARISGLTAEVQQLKEACSTKERRVETLNEQVESRENEITRLGGLLEHGRPRELILAEGKHNSDERLLAQMNIQVEILTEQRQKLEAELEETKALLGTAHSRSATLEAQNGQLCSELRSIQQLSRDLQREADHMRSEHEQLQQSVGNHDDQLRQCHASIKTKEAELQRAATDVKCLQELLEDSEQDAKHTARLLEQMDRDKRALEQRCGQLTETERTLTAELESLRHIATVREEDRARRTKAEHQRVGAVLDDLTATSAVQQEQHDAFQERIHQLEQTCSKLRDERSYYQRQLHDAEQQQKLQQQQQVHSSRDAHQDQPPPLPADGLQQENRQLKKVLQRFESQLKEIQRDLRAVKEERDNLSLLYRQACQQIDDIRNPPLTSSPSKPGHSVITRSPASVTDVAGKSPKTTATPTRSPRQQHTASPRTPTGHEVQALKEERSELTARIASLRSMVTSLEEQVKSSSVATTTAVTERKQAEAVASEMCRLLDRTRERVKALEEDLEHRSSQQAALQAQLQSINQQSSTSSGVVDTLRTQLQTLEEERDGMVRKIRDLQATIARHKDEKETIARRLSEKDRSVHEQHMTIEQLQTNLAGLERGEARHVSQVDELRDALRQVDAERDRLHSQIERQNEEYQRAVKSYNAKISELVSLQSRLQQAGQQIRHGDDRCDEFQRQITHLQQQLEKKDLSLQQCTQQRNAETSRVQQLIAEEMTSKRALDAMRTELTHTIAEREALKVSIQDYTSRLLEFEQALESKEQEKDELLSSFHRLSEERSAVDDSARQFQEETNSVRVEYGQFLQDHKLLQETLRHQAQDIRQLQDGKSESERRATEAERQVAILQGQLQQNQDDMHATISERTAARDLCSRLDQAQEALRQQIAQLSSETERLTVSLQAERSERTAIASQLDAERVSVKNLESLIALERIEVSQKHVQHERLQLDCEKQKEVIAELDNKLRDMEVELQTWQRETQSLATHVKELKRQLTNERYEKEWTLQQLQLAGHTGVGSAGLQQYAPSPHAADDSVSSKDGSQASSISLIDRSPAAGSETSAKGTTHRSAHDSSSSSGVISPLQSSSVASGRGGEESGVSFSLQDHSATSIRSSLPSHQGDTADDGSVLSAASHSADISRSPPIQPPSAAPLVSSAAGSSPSDPATSSLLKTTSSSLSTSNATSNVHSSLGRTQSMPVSTQSGATASQQAASGQRQAAGVGRSYHSAGQTTSPLALSSLSAGQTASPLVSAPAVTTTATNASPLLTSSYAGLNVSTVLAGHVVQLHGAERSSVLAGYIPRSGPGFPLSPIADTHDVEVTTDVTDSVTPASLKRNSLEGRSAGSEASGQSPPSVSGIRNPSSGSAASGEQVGSRTARPTVHPPTSSSFQVDSAIFSDGSSMTRTMATRGASSSSSLPSMGAAGGSTERPQQHAPVGIGSAGAESLDPNPDRPALKSDASHSEHLTPGRHVTFASSSPPLQTPQHVPSAPQVRLDVTPSPDRMSVSSLSSTGSRSFPSDGSGQMMEAARRPQPSDMTVLLLGEQESYRSMGDRLMEEVLKHHPTGSEEA